MTDTPISPAADPAAAPSTLSDAGAVQRYRKKIKRLAAESDWLPEAPTQEEREERFKNLPVVEEDTRTPRERIDDLLHRMNPQKRTIIGAISFCSEPRAIASVNERVAAMQENNYSVFDGPTLCMLLQQAGALQTVTQDGEPFDEDSWEPPIIEVDGVECYDTDAKPELYLLATEDGLSAAGEHDPAGNLKAFIEKNEHYREIYLGLLEECSGGARSIKELSDIYDGHELLKDPHYYTSFFIDQLEENDGLVWEGAWKTTAAGLELLATA